MQTMLQRALGIARLDVATFEEVEHDIDATREAALVVVAASLAAGVGAMGGAGIGGLILGTFAALIGWVLWALAIYFVGGKMMRADTTETDAGELLRVLGYAQAPAILKALGFLPFVGGLIHLLVPFWVIATTVVGVRQALDIESTGRAIVVVLIGIIPYALMMLLLGMMLGGATLGLQGLRAF